MDEKNTLNVFTPNEDEFEIEVTAIENRTSENTATQYNEQIPENTAIQYSEQQSENIAIQYNEQQKVDSPVIQNSYVNTETVYSQQPSYNITSDSLQQTIPTPEPNRKKRRPILRFFSAVAVVMVLALVFEATVIYSKPILTKWINKDEADKEEKNNTPIEMTKSSSNWYTQTSSTNSNATNVTEVANNVSPAIVSINVKVVQDNGWFGSYEAEGSGSGIIFKQDDKFLYIVTNQHVIDSSRQISVKFIDDKTVDATIINTNTEADIAVITVELSDIEASTREAIKIATFGDSDKVVIGEMAVAIGNPLGYNHTVTVGYISGIAREMELTNKTMTLLQTDAAINPGNSGGALVNIQGEIIGINTIKYSSTDVEGMGFAIPINTAKTIIDDILNAEPTAYIGITAQNMPKDNQYGMPEGVYIYQLSIDSPASESGLENGDIIFKIDDEDITIMEELKEYLTQKKPNEEVTVYFYRRERGKYVEKQVNVTLGTKFE